MNRWTVGVLAGSAVAATIVLSTAMGCGLSVTEPRFQDRSDTSTGDPRGGDNTASLFEGGELRFAELTRPEAAARS